MSAQLGSAPASLPLDIEYRSTASIVPEVQEKSKGREY